MKYCEMREVFKDELAFLNMVTDYETGLEPFRNMKEASLNIEAWKKEWSCDDGFPASFTRPDGPSILMSLWNTFIVPDEETKQAIKDEEYDEQFKKDHPDWLAFDACYPNGSCLFIDPESIDFILQQHNYDAAHRELIVEAIKAYHKSYQENL